MKPKHVAGFVVLIAAAACITLATYRDFADGARNPFTAMIVATTGFAFGMYGVARTRWPFGHRVPIVIALAIALPLPIVHAARLLHPAGRGMPMIALHSDLHTNPTSNRDWALTLDPGATATADPDGILVVNVPKTRASLELLLPTTPVWWHAWPLRLLLPVSYDDSVIAETASFDLTVEPLGTFYVVFETESLLVQVIPAGLHLTYRPSGSPAETVESPREPGSIRGRHTWQVRRTPEWITVDIDGAETFARPRPRPLGFIRLGETRSDEFHGGTMRIHDAQYRRWWAGSRRPWWPS
jgi:hypothetical protein